MSQISGEERHLISFFRRLMRYKVNVIATEYALNLKVPAYHMGAIIDEICRPQRVGTTLVCFRKLGTALR